MKFMLDLQRKVVYNLNVYNGMKGLKSMARTLTPAQIIERSIIKKYRNNIWNKFVMGIKEYNLICQGDKIAVAVSGGQSSVVMAKCIQHLQKYSDVKFEVIYITFDPGFSQEKLGKFSQDFEILNLKPEVFRAERDILAECTKAENVCESYACAVTDELLKKAKNSGCNKLALGNNFDDAIEYIFTNMVYNSKVESMLPRLNGNCCPEIEIIRPMYMVKEEYIKDFQRYNSLSLTSSIYEGTPLSKHTQVKEMFHQKSEVKALMERFRNTNENIENNIFKSVYNVNLRNIVAYSKQGKEYNFLDNYRLNGTAGTLEETGGEYDIYD